MVVLGDVICFGRFDFGACDIFTINLVSVQNNYFNATKYSYICIVSKEIN